MIQLSIYLKYMHLVTNAFIVSWYDLICNHLINTVDNKYHVTITKIGIFSKSVKKNDSFLIAQELFLNFTI